MSTERRKFARVYVGVEAEYNRKEEPNRKIKVLVQDISVAGIRFITSEKFDQKNELELKLNISERIDPIEARVTVIWQKRFSESFYDTGVKILEIDKSSQFSLSSHVNKNIAYVKEQREFIRCNLSTMINYKIEGSNYPEKRGLSVDISPSGLKVFVKEPIENNTHLELSFNLPESDKTITVKGKTLWSRNREEGFFEVGIEFLTMEEAHQKKINNYIKDTLGIDW
ncbi:MAG: PilZ domain-containing protein [Candidatus Omnitrophota bacterium]